MTLTRAITTPKMCGQGMSSDFRNVDTIWGHAGQVSGIQGAGAPS